MKKLLKLIITISLAIIVTGCSSTNETTTADSYKVYIDIQDYGMLEGILDGDEAPITVNNFVKLAKQGFYDGLTFHRIIDGFMIQGGDPNGDGTGGSGENITGEFEANGIKNPLSHMRGALSMARGAYDYNSASSQFFIMHEDNFSLDGQYAVFGEITKGLEIVDAIAHDTPVEDDNGTVLKKNQPVIKSIKVEKIEK